MIRESSPGRESEVSKASSYSQVAPFARRQMRIDLRDGDFPPTILSRLADALEILADRINGFPNVVVRAGFRIFVDDATLV